MVVIVIAGAAEAVAYAERALVSIEHHHNQLQIYEWHKAITTIMVSIPIVAIIAILVIWFKPNS